MKKKILIAVVSVILILSAVLAGCASIDVTSKENIDKNVIKIFQDAIKKSEDTAKAGNYYIKKLEKEVDKEGKIIKTIEYKMNFKKDDKSIPGVDNTKLNLDIHHTIGLESFVETYTFGQSVSGDIKAKDIKPSDYKPYMLMKYKKTENAAVFTRNAEELKKGIQDYINQSVPSSLVAADSKIAIKDFSMESVLAPLKALTKDDIAFESKDEKTNKILKNGNYVKGDVQHFAFIVTKEGHPYAKMGAMQVQVFNGRISRVMSADEKNILDTMYEGPKLNIPSYDLFMESGVEVSIVSDRTDGLVALYQYEEDNMNLKVVKLVNPKECAQNEKEKIALVESAVNWNNTYTEVIYQGEKYFVATKNIENNSTDWGSMIPYAAVAVALIALILALMAMSRIKKQNKALTAQIKALSGETAEAEVVEAVAEENANEVVEVEETTETAEEKVEE